jgi:hypothetical protein
MYGLRNHFMTGACLVLLMRLFARRGGRGNLSEATVVIGSFGSGKSRLWHAPTLSLLRMIFWPRSDCWTPVQAIGRLGAVGHHRAKLRDEAYGNIVKRGYVVARSRDHRRRAGVDA